MSDPIKLVRGDNRPFIKVRLFQSDGTLLDVSAEQIVVTINLRSVTTEDILSVLPCVKLNGGVGGEVRFNVPGATLDMVAGAYEGEVVVSFNGDKQTVYDRLKFQVRNRFGTV